MLNWLSKLFRRHQEAPPQRRFKSNVRAVFDDKAITVHDGQGGEATLGWADIGSVTVVTTDLGPLQGELTWILFDRDGRRCLTVPMDAEGEHALLVALQSRLAGFDNMAVVEAMSSTRAAEFQIWPAAEML